MTNANFLRFFLWIAASSAMACTGGENADLNDAGSDLDAGIEMKSITGQSDSVGDCDSEDDGCIADIYDLLYGVSDGILRMELQMVEDFPKHGTFEIFWIPPVTSIPGLSFRLNEGTISFWNADCSVSKHEGCHWYEIDQPESFYWEWTSGTSFSCFANLSEIGFAGQTQLRAGVGAAHEYITTTAEFTDRHPDALWITATEIQGLALIEIQ